MGKSGSYMDGGNEGSGGRDLHIGNLRTALVSWLSARLQNGIWLLRVDDLDKSRNRSGSVQSLQNDLKWLGINWDGPVIFQSKRKSRSISNIS